MGHCKKCIDINLPKLPELFFLDHNKIPINKYNNSVLPHLLSCIPRMWKKKEIPSIKMWIETFEEIRKMELLTSLLYDKKENHTEIWAK